MADNVPDSSEYYAEANLEELAERVKRNFVGWKQLLVVLHKVFIWEQQYYPIVLSAFVTLVFRYYETIRRPVDTHLRSFVLDYSIVWLCDASILTTFSVIGIVIFLCDYFVPLICSNFFDSANWSAKQEKMYSEICTELALGWVTLVSAWNSWQKVKDSKPKVYFMSLLSTLLVLAWIGNLINNLFLTYLITNFVVLLPGLKHHGILQKYVGEGIQLMQNSLGIKQKKK